MAVVTTSKCQQYELKCNNGRCVPFRLTCDNNDGCGDGSDERVICGMYRSTCVVGLLLLGSQCEAYRGNSSEHHRTCKAELGGGIAGVGGSNDCCSNNHSPRQEVLHQDQAIATTCTCTRELDCSKAN